MLRNNRLLASTLLCAIAAISACGCARIELHKSGEGTTSAGVLTGLWDADSYVGQNAVHSKMSLKQEGQQFFGEGSEASGATFSVVNGVIRGPQVEFFKKYSGLSPNAAAVQYIGKISMVAEPDYRGPYLQGTCAADANGRTITGQWRAQMPDKIIAPAVAPPEQTKSAPAAGDISGTSKESNHPVPDLSGKWKMAYECNFKTIKTVVFLEQYGNKITGHGTESGTKHKLIIEDGQYDFPSLVFKCKFSDKGLIPMVFKGTAGIVNDTNYQGAYLSGKTQGGGAWEAEQIR